MSQSQVEKYRTIKIVAAALFTILVIILWAAAAGWLVFNALMGKFSWIVPIGFLVATLGLVGGAITLLWLWIRHSKKESVPVSSRAEPWRPVIPKARSFQWGGLKGNSGFLIVGFIVWALLALTYWVFWQIAGAVKMETWILSGIQFAGCAAAVFPLFKIMDALVAKAPYKQIPDAGWFVRRVGKLYGVGFIMALPSMLVLGILGGANFQFPALISILLVGAAWLAWRNRRVP